MSLKHIDQDTVYPNGKRGLPGRPAIAIVNENTAETEQRLVALEGGSDGVSTAIEALELEQAALQADLAGEAQTRIDMDAALGARIDAEQIARQAGDEALAALVGRIPGKNRLINGDFRFWQRPSPLPAATGARFGPDRWMFGSAGSSVAVNRLPVPQYGGQALADLGSTSPYILEVIVASIPGAANSVYMQQRIEDVRSLSGRLVTISFKARSTLGEYRVGAEFSQVFGAGGSAQANGPRGPIAVTQVWARHRITLQVPDVVGKTIGDGSALQLTLWVDAGANVADRASGIGQKSGTLYITDLQVEEGGSVTAFEWRPDAIESVLCRRFCRVFINGINGEGGLRFNAGVVMERGNNTAVGVFKFGEPMRATPSVTVSAAATWRLLRGNGAEAVTSISVSEVSSASCTLTASSQNLTAGLASILQSVDGNTGGAGIYLDAEL